uniref:Peptidase S1 domain-containing protein n=1 Tax=Malurus cyaneus samueli TaxID=2593467 RepID=A0A8C5TEV8_9PASS
MHPTHPPLLSLLSAYWAWIIGGREVKPHSRPYMAYVRIETGLKSHSCGGFLIRPDAVLTAAHSLSQHHIPPTIRAPVANAAGTSACEVSGWGRTSITGRRSDVMMEVKLMVQREAECQRQFRGYQQQSMICVGDDDGRKGSYRGDSGGPLVCNKKAHGIVSHGCERYICPAVFTRISYFEHWIREQLRRFALQELPGSPSSG